MEVGTQRFEAVLQPVSGKALPVYRGETLRVTQLEGGQCVDFNAFNLHDYKERMSIGHSRLYGLHLKQGEVVFTNPPRLRPMLYLAAMPDTCAADTLGARCNAVMFEERLGFAYHTNCQDTVAEAIREYDLTPDDVHDCFNMFFNTAWDKEGKFWIEANTGEAGDHVDLLACIDTLCVPITCGSGDVQLTSNFFLRPIKIEVFEATRETVDMVETVEDEHKAPRSRLTLEQYRVTAIKTDRQLVANPTYEPAYARWPLKYQRLQIPLSADAVAEIDGMIEASLYRDREDAVRQLFMSTYLSALGEERGVGVFTGGLAKSGISPATVRGVTDGVS